ncbi:MAG: hypothetical protein KJ072_16805 [Verrucomicrobia bacterium]|nr:hypothetical protein [Verrucomicrobiota bacterium]
MKLIRFITADSSSPCFGLVVRDCAISFAGLQSTFERLGTLRCRFAEPTGNLLPSRWPLREPLQKYHQQPPTLSTLQAEI